jgi:hypothetical protein
MIKVAKEWNPKQALLRKILLKPEKFNEAIKLCLHMHSLVHASEMSKSNCTTYEDKLWDRLNEEVFRVTPASKSARSRTIAWNVWHMTRIEDITANILIANATQILTNDWLRKVNTTIQDTGNAMTRDEIADFSQRLAMKELRNYRIAVGRKTQETIGQLDIDDLKRKMRPDQLTRIIDEGGVLKVEGSRWLINFWSKKTVAGILQMPITRHQIVHLNAAFKIKERQLKRA